jgi:preprotein translocase subunit SecA
MNKQREVIYGERRKVLEGEDMRENIQSMVGDLVDEAVSGAVMGSKYAEEWDFSYLDEALLRISRNYTGLGLSENELRRMTPESLGEAAHEKMAALYEDKENEIGTEQMRELERMILLRVIDSKWMDHIDAMDQLKTGIGLRGVGQQDPAAAYAHEGFDMFELMSESIKEDTVRYCYSVTLETKSERKEQTSGDIKESKTDEDSWGAARGETDRKAAQMAAAAARPQGGPPKPSTVRRTAGKVGRNDPCPCGSGKKYKNCCGKNVE